MENGVEIETVSQGDGIKQPNDALNKDQNVHPVPAESAETKMEKTKDQTGPTIDFSAFGDILSGDHCDGNHPQSCKCLDRVIAALEYHQFLVVNPLNEKYGDDPKAAFVSFCDELYPKTAMLNDYIHFTEHHTDPATVEYIQGRLVRKCETVQKCGATSRHYRDRGDGVIDGDGVESLWCIDRMDSIHFTIHHLTELGLRVKATDLESALTADEQRVEDSESVDVALLRLAEIIKAKRAIFTNERLDGTTNSKFTLHVDEMKESGDETGSDGMSLTFYFHSIRSQGDSKCFHSFDDLIITKKAKAKDTKRDVVLELIWNKLTDKLLWRTLQKVVVEQDMDSDCIEADVEEQDDSNLYVVLERNYEIIDALRAMLRHSKIMEKSFATGLPLFYWKWHRKATKEMVTRDRYLSSYMDLGGRSVQESSVDPRYDSIKEEVLATGLVSPQQFQENVVEKTNQYLKSDKCKQLKCKPMRDEENPLHFEIKKGDGLQPRHLHAIILYCDFTKLCTLFSRSLRKNGPNDGLKEIKKNNSKFFHFTKALREIIAYFGSDGVGFMNGFVEGPFYSEVSVVLNLSEFSIGFNTPTSTTMTGEIALRFAGSNGMILTTGNQKGTSKYQPVFSAKWISAFSEEDEYLWFGSVFKLSVENIFILESSKSYKQSIGALYLFAAALSGQRAIGQNVTLEEQRILNECIASVFGGDWKVVSKAVDESITDNMYCFCNSKTKIFLNLLDIYRMNSYFHDLIFHGMTESEDIPTDRTNVFKASIFNMFPNLVEVELWVYDRHRLNLLSLLSVLNELVVPPSFQMISLNDWRCKWLKDALNDVVKEQYSVSGWNMEYQRIDGDGDWLFITKINE